MYNNIVGKVIKKELEILEQEEATYNFEVEDNHNYYVSEESKEATIWSTLKH